MKLFSRALAPDRCLFEKLNALVVLLAKKIMSTKTISFFGSKKMKRPLYDTQTERKIFTSLSLINNITNILER